MHSTPTPTCYSTPIWFSVGVHVQIPTFHLSRRNRRQASRGRWEEFFCRFFGGCSQNRSLMHCAQAEPRFTHASPPDPRVHFAKSPAPQDKTIVSMVSYDLLLEYHYALYSTPTCYSTPIWFSVGVHVQIPTFNATHLRVPTLGHHTSNMVTGSSTSPAGSTGRCHHITTIPS